MLTLICRRVELPMRCLYVALQHVSVQTPSVLQLGCALSRVNLLFGCLLFDIVAGTLQTVKIETESNRSRLLCLEPNTRIEIFMSVSMILGNAGLSPQSTCQYLDQCLHDDLQIIRPVSQFQSIDHRREAQLNEFNFLALE